MRNKVSLTTYGRRLTPLLLSVALHALIISGVVYIWRSFTADRTQLSGEQISGDVIDIRIVPESELVRSPGL